HDTIGRDLVGMVVDDIVVVGAAPLFMTDYIACGKVFPERIADIVRGIAEGCAETGTALVGGETAEHPGLLGVNDYDVAGAATGVVEADKVLGAERVRQTEALIGPGWLGKPMADDERIILAGDLNAISRSPSYRMLARHLRDAQIDAGGRPAATFPSRLPLFRIDHLFIGAGVTASRTFVHSTPLARRASDHLPLCADLEIA
ncbi:MAG: AIR synthase related protein, partial [Shinella sp.]